MWNIELLHYRNEDSKCFSASRKMALYLFRRRSNGIKRRYDHSRSHENILTFPYRLSFPSDRCMTYRYVVIILILDTRRGRRILLSIRKFSVCQFFFRGKINKYIKKILEWCRSLVIFLLSEFYLMIFFQNQIENLSDWIENITQNFPTIEKTLNKFNLFSFKKFCWVNKYTHTK